MVKRKGCVWFVHAASHNIIKHSPLHSAHIQQLGQTEVGHCTTVQVYKIVPSFLRPRSEKTSYASCSRRIMTDFKGVFQGRLFMIRAAYTTSGKAVCTSIQYSAQVASICHFTLKQKMFGRGSTIASELSKAGKILPGVHCGFIRMSTRGGSLPIAPLSRVFDLEQCLTVLLQRRRSRRRIGLLCLLHVSTSSVNKPAR